MGRELNPRILGDRLDLKFFFELRPGLIGWMLIDWSLLASQYKQTGDVTSALALVVVFQTVYVFDALKNEVGLAYHLCCNAISTDPIIVIDNVSYVLYLCSCAGSMQIYAAG